jgi:penicillin-binding protein 1A
LVGLLKAPSRLSPLRNPQLAKERQSVVINAMKEAGYVHSNERLAAFELAPVHTQDQRQIRYFSDWLLDRVNARIGAVEKDLIVKTTLLPELQMIAEKTLLSTLISHGKEANMRQGAVLVVENNGALRAMIGGRDYAHSQFNRVTQAYRPPGSAFKPFVYLSALEQGWEFDDKIIDEPVTSGDYRPGNFADEYHGEVSLAHALIHSLNTATIRLASQVGIGYVIGTARKLGITSELDRNLSLALGSSGITLMEMVSAYLTFPNMGRKTDIFAITSIQDSEGNIYYEADLPSQTDQYRLFARQNIAQLNYVLEKVVEEGTGRAAQIPTSAAGKTGTSQNFRDAWFIGYTAKYTAGIWVGNDNNEPMNRVTGGSYPAQVWQQIMARSIQEGLIPSQSGLEYRASQEQNSFSDFISNILSGGTRHQTPDNPQPKYNQ